MLSLKDRYMLTPPQVVENYFLESRHMLLEIASAFDRYDAAVARAANGNAQATENEKNSGAKKLAVMRKALEIVAQSHPARERTLALLELFATV